jgi:hypothetical protein
MFFVIILPLTDFLYISWPFVYLVLIIEVGNIRDMSSYMARRTSLGCNITIY